VSVAQDIETGHDLWSALGVDIESAGMWLETLISERSEEIASQEAATVAAGSDNAHTDTLDATELPQVCTRASAMQLLGLPVSDVRGDGHKRKVGLDSVVAAAVEQADTPDVSPEEVQAVRMVRPNTGIWWCRVAVAWCVACGMWRVPCGLVALWPCGLCRPATKPPAITSSVT